jgi:hypothetical protein
MTAVTGTVTEISPALGVKVLSVTAPATTDDADTIAIDLSTYGCSTFLGIIGFTHSTTGSIVITEAPTTAVSGTTLTITVGGSTDNKARVFIVYAQAQDDTNITAP